MPGKYFLKSGASGSAIRRKRTSAYSAAVQARRAARRANAAANRTANMRSGGYVDLESKFLDSELTATTLTVNWTSLNPTGTGCTNSISVPAQGDGESDRDGRVYYIQSVHVKGAITTSATESEAAPEGDGYARVILYWDTQSNKAEATATDIMDAGGTDDFLAFRNLQNSKRFIVLKDKIIKIKPMLTNEGAINSFSQAPSYQFFKFNKKFKKPIKVRCTGTTANVSSVSDNNFGIAALVNSQTNIPAAQIQYQARIRFRD